MPWSLKGTNVPAIIFSAIRVVWRWSLLLMLSLFTSTSSASPPSAEYRLIESAITKAIAPQHQVLERRIQDMTSAGEKFCLNPDESSFNAVRIAWTLAMQSWSALAPINFGPIDDDNAAWNFQFWPDPINLVERKFKSRISGQNPATKAEDLTKASVAIQGFSAIEYLLFDPSVGSLEHYRNRVPLCPLLIGTLSNLVHSARVLNEAWQHDYPKRLLDPLREQTHPGFQKLHVESLFSGIVMAVGSIRDQKLGQALSIARNENTEGTDFGELSLLETIRPNPWMLESWRSQTSLQQMEASLRFSQNLYQLNPGLGSYLITLSPPSHALDTQIRRAFKDALDILQAMDESAFALLQRGDTAALIRLHQSIHHLHGLLRVEYARAAGIQFRFNAHDGD